MLCGSSQSLHKVKSNGRSCWRKPATSRCTTAGKIHENICRGFASLPANKGACCSRRYRTSPFYAPWFSLFKVIAVMPTVKRRPTGRNGRAIHRKARVRAIPRHRKSANNRFSDRVAHNWPLASRSIPLSHCAFSHKVGENLSLNNCDYQNK